ncbi:protein BatD [Subsaximicrobium wynnwilliamsii]|uniref:Protein BatD n=1 Tax=Subsaximicrobium wynnwilliamsii TaxID=291179 RepID=A0A5C6ZF49_9FLAO|nr:BatD family protein [Subsaximicrobium wynnwilliamsii]TXD82722.1 protein BatD [Subsaximicrobium wynnwilliamsii]TXD88457.1 protein BatD [Subsaximicrobium wynnwilliamsii]TXE02384.1 protein BatD [Subsaximicrobium wynnwilliamsii]
MNSLKHIPLILVMLITSMAFAQTKFETKVSKTKLGQNERLRVDFEMNKDGDNFNPPDFADFTVVGGPNTSVSNSWMNGIRSYAKTYSYFLAPTRQGTLKIGKATIEIEGETFSTDAVSVLVTAPVQRPNDPNNSVAKAEENLHLVAEVSKMNPYLNEAITVVYKLYVSQNIGVTDWRETSSPKYNDFWSQKIEMQNLQAQNGTFKGEAYRYVVLRKTVLYPQKTGKLEIEPLTLDLTVQVPTNRRDFFGGRHMAEVVRTISAGSRTINVKPLPEEGKPADFTGAVGDFKFNVITSKSKLNASESLEAKVEVTGNGNLKLFQLPKLKLPSSLEVYEPEHNENVRTDLGGMQGSISDNYTVVPQYKGKYPIPSISFSYFDLNTETYKRVSSGEIVIDVIEGPINSTAGDNNRIASEGNKQKVVLSNDQFAYIKTDAKLKPINQPDFFNSSVFWSSMLLPLLAIPLALVYRKKKEERDADVFGNKIRKADRLAKRYLSEAKKSLGQKEAFYIALERALHNYLKGKIHIETSDFSKEKIEEILLKEQVDQATVAEFISILQHCELARYTPITNVEMQQDYEKAARTISVIDKDIK